MDKETLKAIRLALEEAWDRALIDAQECKDNYSIGYHYGFARGLMSALRALNERTTLPIETGLEEVEGMK